MGHLPAEFMRRVICQELLQLYFALLLVLLVHKWNDRMKLLLAVLLICGFTFIAQSRITNPTLTYQQMFDQADLVTIAQPISTNDIAERIVLPDIFPDIEVVGVETEFVVQMTLKGNKAAAEKFVLHHYKMTKPVYRSGPRLVAFKPTNKEFFLLFLKKEFDGRFAPINGQTDPGRCGIFPAERIDLIAIAKPVSPKEPTEQTTWFEHYRGRSDTTPTVYLTGYQTEFAVQELLKGEKAMAKFVLHHYERVTPVNWSSSMRFPLEIDFKPDRDRLYLLILKKEAEGRFAPITRPGVYGEDTTPQGFSVIRLESAPQ